MSATEKMPPRRSTRRRPSSISSLSSDSSESSRFSFQGLLESPPPSPALPSIVPRNVKKSPFRFRNLLRLFLKLSALLLGAGVVLWVLLTALYSTGSRFDISYLSHDGETYDLVGDDSLPKEPTPVVVTDKSGQKKWTISIPPAIDFPLKPSAYASLCSASEDIAQHLIELKSHAGSHGHGNHFDYYHVDGNFIDVPQAEEFGILPTGTGWSWHSGKQDKDTMSEDLNTMQAPAEDKYCQRSLTYVMETSDAGFGKTMMGLWMSYGLAKKEGRAFFIDDRYWAYGKYSTFFQPPASPSCLPPPDHQRLPCPHHARHLLVSAATIPWTFGHGFNEQFEDAHKVGVLRQEPMFAFLRAGYEALFHLADADAQYVDKRVHEFDWKIRDKGGLMVGVHVRHGDRHPWEYQYQKSYIPLENYMDAARESLITASTNKNGSEDHVKEMMSKVILASDDPDVYTSVEVSHALRAQEYILLASKSNLDAAQGYSKSNDKFVDDNVGWEGGFFKDVFWGLGDPTPSKTARSLQLREEQMENEGRIIPSEQALQLRALVGRAYLLDLAVIGKSDKIVCGASSVGCRLLAVMMGWEKGIVKQSWRNVDGDFDWKGIVW